MRRLGLRPGRPFVHRLGIGRDRAVRAVTGLPRGLRFDAAAGVIAGRAEVAGSHRVTVDGDGPSGPWTESLDLVVGDDICLTPPLGWNSWNGFGTNVTEADVRRAAGELIDRGLADQGWVHVNIDDGWQGVRDRRGRLQPNDKFGDLKTLCHDLHSVGLRVGIYSSPGPTTCGGFVGSAGHEMEDAESFAAWGFDYLKYDWCSAGPLDDDTPVETQAAPFVRMRAALDRIDRDVVYHVCQYGFGKVWTWARERVGANAWRTTGDIEDRWESIDRIGFGQADLAPYAGPAGWNDPDMLVLGRVGGGWYRSMHPTLLTRDEERTHLGLWVLLCAPLLLGCDLTALDAATVELAANREVLDVHQDPLGRQAIQVKVDRGIETWRKEMSDGSSAIGIFNRNDGPAAAAVEWRALGLSGPVAVRDLWEQRDLNAPVGFETTLPAHGSVLLRVRPSAETDRLR